MLGVTALAFSVALVAATPAVSPPATHVCSASEGGVFTPAWCGKTSPGSEYESFRAALAEYQARMFDVTDALATAIGAFQPIGQQCDDNPPVDPVVVDLIISGMNINGRPMLDKANEARNRMLTAARSVFEGDPNRPQVDAALRQLRSAVEGFGQVMMTLDSAGESYSMSACDPGDAATTKAAADLVRFGQRSNQQVVSLSRLLGQSQKECTSAKSTEPLNRRQFRKRSGTKTTKTTRAGGMTVQYPKSMDVGGKGVWLPLNVTTESPSAYLRIEFTRAAKGLSAVGGGTGPAEFGLLMKVPANTEPGKGRLLVSIRPPGGSERADTVRIPLE